MHGRTEVVIYPKRMTWEHRVDGTVARPATKLDQDRVWAESFDDIDRWIRSEGMKIRTDHYEYWLAIGNPDTSGYTHYNMPVPANEFTYLPLAEAIWNVLDLHIAFEMWKQRA